MIALQSQKASRRDTMASHITFAQDFPVLTLSSFVSEKNSFQQSNDQC